MTTTRAQPSRIGTPAPGATRAATPTTHTGPSHTSTGIHAIDLPHIYHTRRDRTPALHQLTLHVADGELIAVIGRCDRGRSTLLRPLAGLLAPTSGRLHLHGTPVADPRRDMAMFQRPALLAGRTVRDNVLLPAQMLHPPRDELRPLASELINLAGHDGSQRRLPHELSAGMQQRVALWPRAADPPPRAADGRAVLRPGRAHRPGPVPAGAGPLHVAGHYRGVRYPRHRPGAAAGRPGRRAVRAPRPHPRTGPVAVPRPRTLGRHTRTADSARLSAKLHASQATIAPREAAAATQEGT